VPEQVQAQGPEQALVPVQGPEQVQVPEQVQAQGPEQALVREQALAPVSAQVRSGDFSSLRHRVLLERSRRYSARRYIRVPNAQQRMRVR